MPMPTEFNGLISGMLTTARASRGPITIGIPCASYDGDVVRELAEHLARRAADAKISIRGICCDASMVGKLGVHRTDLYGGLLHGAPVSLRGPFDVIEFTLLAIPLAP